MSSKGIFTAVSGAMAQSQRLDTIANNIANANTASFKKDQQTFYEYLSAAERPPNVIQVPRVPASIESFYDMQGGDRGYVDSSGTFTSFRQGQLRPTGAPLDMALDGRGFFEVLTPQGVRWTRNGQFKVDSTGALVTKEGHPVLREGNQDPTQRRIQLGSDRVTVAENGELYEGGNLVGRLSVVEMPDADALKKQGSSLYALKENYPQATLPATNASVKQGYVELSNVNIIEEMTDMIAATRVFEATQKAIKAHDQLDEKLVNQVPKA